MSTSKSASRTARRIVIEKTGDASVMRLEEHALASLASDEVLVEHKAVGLNYIDIYHREGLYPLTLPSGLGLEAAGVVLEVGSAVSTLKAGARVGYNSAGVGAYASRRVVKAARLVSLPDDLDFTTAAACLLRGMTVEYLVCRTYPVQRGERVLLMAAAGGVGLLAVQWLKRLGAFVIGCVGSASKALIAKQHGCDEVILYRSESIAERVRAITDGEGVAVVYDSVGAATFRAALDSLKERGTMVSFGNASGAVEKFDLALLSQKGSLFITRPSLLAYVASREDLELSAERLFAMLATGLKVEVADTLPLSEAGEAHRRLEARETSGALVLLP